MAKLKSIFQVSGDIGGTNMYTQNGEQYVRNTTTLTKDRIMKDPKFKRTRENMMEFGGAGMVAKALRTGLASVVKRYGDGRLSSRLTGRFRTMTRTATGIRGQRPIEPLANKHLLEGMPLHRSISLETVMTLPVDLAANVDRNGATMTLTQLNPDTDLTVPDGATHFKVLLLVVGLTDHVYDPAKESYSAANAAVNSAKYLASTAEMAVTGLPPTTITLTATLPGSPVMATTDALLALVGVEYYQSVSGSYYVLESGNAMDIVKVF
jgi:hypothetical protein